MIPPISRPVRGSAVRTLASTALLALIVLLPVQAMAHRVNVFAWVEGSVIHTESSFVNGNPVKGGTIQVLDAATGQELHSGSTDDQGLYSFDIPQAAIDGRLDLTIVILAGEGHRGDWPMTAAEYLPESAGPPAAEPAAEEAAEETGGAAVEAPEQGAAPSGTVTMDEAALEALVDRVVARHTSGLQRELAALRQNGGPGVAEIVGGIGWVLGLAGMFFYFKARKR